MGCRIAWNQTETCESSKSEGPRELCGGKEKAAAGIAYDPGCRFVMQLGFCPSADQALRLYWAASFRKAS